MAALEDHHGGVGPFPVRLVHHIDEGPVGIRRQGTRDALIVALEPKALFHRMPP
jgi:hypothetical protein